MNGSTAVAITSVLTAGFVGPMIAFVATRWQVSRSSREALGTESRTVLDDSVRSLAAFSHANGYCTALWQRGVSDDAVEAKDALKLRAAATEAVLAIYGRLCIRFGPESMVSRKFLQVHQAVDRFSELVQHYRKGESFPTVEAEWKTVRHAYVQAREAFFEACYQAWQVRLEIGVPHDSGRG
jgi:hypothetical protein